MSLEDINLKNSALVVIDMVNQCCHEKCENPEIGITFSNIRKVAPRLSQFVSDYRNMGGKIIFTNVTPWTKEYLPENIIELYKDPKVVYYGEGTEFENSFFEVKPEKEDIIITKNNYDTFSNPEFEKILNKNGIKYLIVTGFFTDGCVLATISGGFARGFNFVILKDLVETTDLKVRRELSERLINYTFPVLYGKTLESKEFLEKIVSNNIER
jgi:ureidoacrylate peracid hydrolase